MPRQFACPKCGAERVIDDSLLGATGTCVACGRSVTITEANARPARSSSWISRRVVIVAIAYIVALALAIFILWLVMTNRWG